MIARDERRVVPAHQILTLGTRLRLPQAARLEPLMPELEFGIGRRGLQGETLGRERAERVGEVGEPPVGPGDKMINKRPVFGVLLEQPQLQSHAVQPVLLELETVAVLHHLHQLECMSESNSGNIASASRPRFHWAICGWLA